MLLNTPVGQAMTPATTEVDGSRREVEFLHTAPTGLSPAAGEGDTAATIAADRPHSKST